MFSRSFYEDTEETQLVWTDIVTDFLPDPSALATNPRPFLTVAPTTAKATTGKPKTLIFADPFF